MSSSRRYVIDNDNRIISADILALNKKEQQELERYMKFGYTVVDSKLDRKPKKYNSNRSAYNRENIESYLKSIGRVDLIEKFNEKCNEKGDKVIVKKGGTQSRRSRGFMYGVQWFKTLEDVDIEQFEREYGDEVNELNELEEDVYN